MILIGFSFFSTVTTILIVSLIVLIVAILYRRLLNRLNSGEPIKAEYCVLYDLEQNPVVGKMEIYFTCEKPQSVRLCLFNVDFTVHREIEELQATTGGHIVRFDTTTVPNGNYFFGLITANQKTMKKCQINN